LSVSSEINHVSNLYKEIRLFPEWSKAGLWGFNAFQSGLYILDADVMATGCVGTSTIATLYRELKADFAAPTILEHVKLNPGK